MKPILRFKESIHHIEAGALMALGAQVKPDPGAVQRAAHRLGVSSAALAAAQAAAMKAAAEAGSVATATATVASGAGSVFAASAIKGVAIGLCLSGLAYVGVHLPNTPKLAAPVNAPATQASPKPAGSAVAAVAVGVSASTGVDETVRALAARRGSTTPAQPALGPASTGTSAPGVVGVRGPEPVRRVTQAAEATASPPPLPADVSVATTTGSFAAGPGAAARSVDPRVMQEVMSLDRVRKLSKQGNAALAMRELDDFDRVHGYRFLSSESKLVRIDVLLSLGMRQVAAGVARQLLLEGAPATQRQRLMALANSGATPEAPATTPK